MTAIRSIRAADGQFVIISNKVLQDSRLSWQARGIVAFVLSLPPTAHLTAAWLQTQAPNGRESLRSALRELKECGYYRCERRQDDLGRWNWDQVVSDSALPSDGNPLDGSPSHKRYFDSGENKDLDGSGHTDPDRPGAGDGGGDGWDVVADDGAGVGEGAGDGGGGGSGVGYDECGRREKYLGGDRCPASKSGQCLKSVSAAITDHPACVDGCEHSPYHDDQAGSAPEITTAEGVPLDALLGPPPSGPQHARKAADLAGDHPEPVPRLDPPLTDSERAALRLFMAECRLPRVSERFLADACAIVLAEARTPVYHARRVRYLQQVMLANPSRFRVTR